VYDLRTFVVQCRDCNEDVVFKQAASTTAEPVMLGPIQLRCGACCTTHVYARDRSRRALAHLLVPGVSASRLGGPAHARRHHGASISSLIPSVKYRRCSPKARFAMLEMLTVRAPLPLQRTPEGLFSPCDRRNMKARRRNRVSEPDPSKEGPVSKGTGLQILQSP
jgi:hypothetical protein